MEEVNTPLVINQNFMDIHEALPTIENVDMVSTGMSPATIRYLTKNNKYINVGLEETVVPVEKTKTTEAVVGKCTILANNNSFEVTPSELKQVHSAIESYFSKPKEETK